MIGVVIPVFNKVELTRRCLESLLQNSRAVSSVVVVDNASVDSTPAFLAEAKESFLARGIAFDFIRNEENQGFGRACNQGIRKIKEDWIVVLNNDTWLSAEWDLRLVRDADRLGFDVIGPHFDERPWTESMEQRAEEFVAGNRDRSRRHFVPILMCFRRSAVDRLRFDHGGIFDERFFVTYEDTDLRHRMDLSGLRYGQTSNAFIWHQSMGTRSSPGLLAQGYERQGLELFIEKWGFDPRKSENRLIPRWVRKFRKWKHDQGRF